MHPQARREAGAQATRHINCEVAWHVWQCQLMRRSEARFLAGTSNLRIDP